MKAQDDDPLPRAVQGSTPARFARRQSLDSPSTPSQPMTPSRPSPSYAHPASLLPPPAPPPSGLTHPADALSLSCSRRPSASRAAIDATPVCRERARMREIGGRGVARTAENALDHSCRRRASRPCCLAENDRRALVRPKTPKLVGEGQRALDARRRRSPDPTDALAHRNSPRAGPRSLPSSAWSRVA